MKKKHSIYSKPETKAVHIWYVESKRESINENTGSFFSFEDIASAYV